MRDRDTKLYHKQIGLNVLLALVSGAALFLAFPKPGLYPLAWVALVPLFIAIRRSRPAGSLLLGLITGFTFFSCLIFWISLFGYAPWVLLSLVEALFIAVFALLANIAFRHRSLGLLAVPALWTAMEWAKTLGTYAFLWGSLANSQVKWLQIIQIASITGPWGITFLIVFVNAAIATLIWSRDKRSSGWLVAAGVAVVLTAVSGAVSIHGIDMSLVPTKSIALVQGNVEMTWPDQNEISRIYTSYWPLTKSIGKCDLIVWPETALPGDLLASPSLQNEMAQLARSSSAYMLVGGPHTVPDGRFRCGYREYNGAYLVDPTGQITGVYYKVHLVPFGEFVPGRNTIPFIDKFPILYNDRSPGTGYHTLKSSAGDMGVVICFESTFPQIARKLSEQGAQILLVITNDSWFKNTPAADQHHDCSILRAVENRRYVARNATTGISSLIDPTGRVISTVGLGKQAVIRAKVAMMTDKSFYSRFGDWFAYICLAFGLIVILFAPKNSKNTRGHSR